MSLSGSNTTCSPDRRSTFATRRLMHSGAGSPQSPSSPEGCPPVLALSLTFEVHVGANGLMSLTVTA